MNMDGHRWTWIKQKSLPQKSQKGPEADKDNCHRQRLEDGLGDPGLIVIGYALNACDM